MAKPVSLTGSDLEPQSKAREQDRLAPVQTVPISFRMPPEFVYSFKREALERGMKLNEYLNACFQEMPKVSK